MLTIAALGDMVRIEMARGGKSLGEALWWNLNFFSDIGSLFVAVVFAGIALGVRAFSNPRVLGQALLTILLVALVYLTIGGGWQVFGRLDSVPLGDLGLHLVTPALTSLYWLFLAPHGALRWRDAPLWSLFPLTYLAYALARGGLQQLYAYPWLDVTALGYGPVLLTAAVIAAIFVIGGLGVIALDRILATRAPRA